MNPALARDLLVNIATRDLDKREQTSNRAPWIKKLWPLTDYPEGYDERAPYCAAGMCYVLAAWIEELKRSGELVATLGMTGAQAERWRCKSAAAWEWMDWADRRGAKSFPESEPAKKGDFVVFDFHHIGMVVADHGETISTIEYNTNEGGSREGDGCLLKARRRQDVQRFIRVIP
jgi:hypothetical protein